MIPSMQQQLVDAHGGDISDLSDISEDSDDRVTPHT